MDNRFYLQGPEDEMEFMPIIPLNEDDNENADEQVIPEELPLLPLRNTVLFPGVVIPITVFVRQSMKQPKILLDRFLEFVSRYSKL